MRLKEKKKKGTSGSGEGNNLRNSRQRQLCGDKKSHGQGKKKGNKGKKEYGSE